MNVQVTQDQHIVAFEWLEDNVEKKVFQFDVDDLIAMVEQVVIEQKLTRT